MMASGTLEIAKNDLVSVIIPVYNRENTLPRLFTSLEAITYHPVEIILVDNASSDRSLELCQQYQYAPHPEGHTVIVSTETTPGACAARNQGIALASGNFLYFFDSDDTISPDFIEKMSPNFSNNDLICAPTRMFFPNGSSKTRACVPTDKPYDHILSASLSTQTFIVRKSFLIETGSWNEQLTRWNDWELALRLLCHQPRMKWNQQKAYHQIYQHPNSISGTSFTDDAPQLLKSLKAAARDLEDSQLKVRIKKKSINALIFKALILSKEIYKEGNKSLAHTIAAGALQHLNPSRRLLAGTLHRFSLHMPLPGLWRLYLLLV